MMQWLSQHCKISQIENINKLEIRGLSWNWRQVGPEEHGAELMQVVRKRTMHVKVATTHYGHMNSTTQPAAEHKL